MEPMSAAVNPCQAANVTPDPDVYDDGFLPIEHNSLYVCFTIIPFWSTFTARYRPR